MRSARGHKPPARGTAQMSIETMDRRGLHEIECLALRDALGDIEQHHIAEFLLANEMGERAGDLAGADQSNLGTRHQEKNLG